MWFWYSILGLIIVVNGLRWWNYFSPFSALARQLLPMADPLYERMTARDKNRFRYRFNELNRTTNFILKQGLTPAKLEKVRTIVMLAAARLSLHLSKRAFDQYEKIIVYPSSYYSNLGHAYHKGEVNPGMGFIVLSYEHIVRGFETQEGVNLVYHELAHALWLEHKLYNYDVFNSKDFDEYEAIARLSMETSGQDEPHFFRDYAFTNAAEFFAVAVENFFERPREFDQAMPGLYASLARLFKQDWGSGIQHGGLS